MRLSRKSDYALRALMTLAEQPGRTISIRELSDLNDVPRRFLEHIMLEMKSRGIVRSVAGRVGGFSLAMPPEQVTMGMVVRIFDEILAPITCVSAAHYVPCSQEKSCRFRRVLLDIRNYTARRMDEATLESLVRLKPVLPKEVFTGQFLQGDGI